MRSASCRTRPAASDLTARLSRREEAVQYMEELGYFDWFTEVGACANSRELVDFLRRGVRTDHDDRDTPGCFRALQLRKHIQSWQIGKPKIE